jgi:hypothetical protein
VKTTFFKVFLIGLILSPAGLFSQNLLLNGNFETGNLSDWTTFLTPDGSLGSGLPDVVPFDVAGTGTASNAAQFQAGELTSSIGAGEQGGGIEQTFNCSSGQYLFSANVAAFIGSFGFANSDAGQFTMLVDGKSVAQITFGEITAGQTDRGSLEATMSLSAGSHEISIETTRPALNDADYYGATPLQYLDNIQVVPVPEPNGIGLCLAGFSILIAARFRNLARLPKRTARC